MADDNATRLGRRATMLASRMNSTATALANGLGAGGTPAFTTPMTESASFAWWRQHRNDEFGGQVVAMMPPERVAELDAWLGQKIADERGMPSASG